MMQRPEWISSVKTATRCTIALIGTFDDAARVTHISRSVLWRCATATEPDVISLPGAMRLMQETGSHEILTAMAASMGFALERVGEAEMPTCVASAFGPIAADFGELAYKVGEALADGRVTLREFHALIEIITRLNRSAAIFQGMSPPSAVAVSPNGRAA